MKENKKELPSERYNIIDFIKFELLDNKTRLDIFVKKQLRKRKYKINLDAIKLRIWKLEETIKVLDQLNSIPIKLFTKKDD